MIHIEALLDFPPQPARDIISEVRDFLFRRPRAYIPILMSAAALLFTFFYIAIVGLPKVKAYHDEGAAAHIFQLLMAGQVPIIVYFAIRWLPQKPKQALQILLLQVTAAILAFAPVFFLEL